MDKRDELITKWQDFHDNIKVHAPIPITKISFWKLLVETLLFLLKQPVQVTDAVGRYSK